MTGRGRLGLPPWARWVTGIVIAVIAVNLLLSWVRSIYGGAGGRPSSSYATAPNGIAAFAELLARRGHPVSPLRGSLADGLPQAGVLVVLDPESITGDEIRALRTWVSDGGHLVIGGRPQLWVEELLDSPPRWSPAGLLEAQPLADVPETVALERVGGEGFGTWEDSAGALPVLGLPDNPARTVAAVATIGDGRAVLLADTTPLHNRFLSTADNAAFALNLAGRRGTPVYFAEGVHGYGSETGLAAIPFRWKLSLGGLALAAVVWMVAAGRRLGPPEPAGRDLPPPRRAYVDALTTTLARTRRGDEVIAPMRAAARSKIARRSGMEPDADAHALQGAARALGLTEGEIDAVFGRSGADPIGAGRALAKLGGRDW